MWRNQAEELKGAPLPASVCIVESIEWREPWRKGGRGDMRESRTFQWHSSPPVTSDPDGGDLELVWIAMGWKWVCFHLSAFKQGYSMCSAFRTVSCLLTVSRHNRAAYEHRCVAPQEATWEDFKWKHRNWTLHIPGSLKWHWYKLSCLTKSRILTLEQFHALEYATFLTRMAPSPTFPSSMLVLFLSLEARLANCTAVSHCQVSPIFGFSRALQVTAGRNGLQLRFYSKHGSSEMQSNIEYWVFESDVNNLNLFLNSHSKFQIFAPPIFM